MKAVLFSIVAVAALAVATGAPVIQAADWVKVSSKVDQLEAGTRGGLTAIQYIATNDSSTHGVIIEAKINVVLAQSAVLVEQMRVAIRAQLYTDVQARGHIEELHGYVYGVYQDVQVNLEELTAEAKASILKIFEDIDLVADRIANEIIAALENQDGGDPGLDWDAVNDGVETLRTTVVDFLGGAGTAAVADNPVIGSMVQVQLSVAESAVHAQIGRMKSGIVGKTLTLSDATYFLTNYQTMLNNTIADSQETISELSADAQTAIQGILTTGVAQVVTVCDNVIALMTPNASRS